jgi:hypothetical protein
LFYKLLEKIMNMSTPRVLVLLAALHLTACVGGPISPAMPDPRIQNSRLDISLGASVLPKYTPPDRGAPIIPNLQLAWHFLRYRHVSLSALTHNVGAGLAFQWQLAGFDDDTPYAFAITPSALLGDLKTYDNIDYVYGNVNGSQLLHLPYPVFLLPFTFSHKLTAALDTRAMLRLNHSLLWFGKPFTTSTIGAAISLDSGPVSTRTELLFTFPLRYDANDAPYADNFTDLFPALQLQITLAIR